MRFFSRFNPSVMHKRVKIEDPEVDMAKKNDPPTLGQCAKCKHWYGHAADCEWNPENKGK